MPHVTTVEEEADLSGWTLETFPFKKQPGVSQKQMCGFAELDFVARIDRLARVDVGGAAASVIDQARTLVGLLSASALRPLLSV